MKRVLRIDRARIDSFERNSAGFIQTPAYLTKVGVLVYRKADGSVVRELRHPEDVFNPISLKTLVGVPVTNEHPERLVDTKNIKQLAIGYIGDSIEIDGDFLKAKTVTIFDEKSIRDVESGKVELSCGYECELEEAPGVYEGEAYDLRQRNIHYNHVSVVDEGRAGPQVRLRLDSNDAIVDSIADNYLTSKGDEQMEKILIEGVEYPVSPELKAVLEKFMADSKVAMDECAKMKSDLMAAGSKEAEMQKSLDAEKAKVDETQAKLDSAMEENKKIKTDSNDEKRINAIAEEKMKVLSVAGVVLGKEFKADGLTNIEIKKKVLESKSIDLTNKSDVYVEARYDALAETLNEEVAALKSLGDSVMTRHDGVKSADDARKEAMERSRNAWNKK